MSNSEPPSLDQQAWAVEWAATHLDARKGRIDTRGMRESERRLIEQALRAALETLRTMQFARETLR